MKIDQAFYFCHSWIGGCIELYKYVYIKIILIKGRLAQKQVDATNQLIVIASDTVANMLGIAVHLVKNEYCRYYLNL